MLKYKQVTLAEMPKCDFCSEEARFDSPTNIGPWAYTCEKCYISETPQATAMTSELTTA